MADKLTKKDIISFGKVLSYLGTELQTNPDILLANLVKKEEKPKEIKSVDQSKADLFPLLEIARENTLAVLRGELEEFDIEELRYLALKYKIGHSRSRVKTKTKLISHLCDYAKERSVDVFLTEL